MSAPDWSEFLLISSKECNEDQKFCPVDQEEY